MLRTSYCQADNGILAEYLNTSIHLLRITGPSISSITSDHQASNDLSPEKDTRFNTIYTLLIGQPFD